MSDETVPTVPERFFDRREILSFGAAATFLAALCGPTEALAAAKVANPRTISLYNVNTGEKLIRAEYWSKGKYLKDSLRSISRLLRDHRTGEIKSIDPRLVDLMSVLQSRVGNKQPFTVISGYRSPSSNRLLREDSSGVARHSYHMEGKAVDIRMPGSSLRGLHQAALRLKSGGVGFYPSSDFVHVDVGPVRVW